MGLPLYAVLAFARRLLGRAALLGALAIGLFYLLQTMPASGEARRLEDPRLSQAELDRIRTVYGLDRPVHERLRCWLLGRAAPGCPYASTERGILGGDLGRSEVHRAEVSALIAQRLPSTLRMAVPALLLALLLGIGLGAWAAARGGWVDRGVSSLAFGLVALPSHVVGLTAILLFAITWRVLPAGGWGNSAGPDLLHLLLPVSVLSLHFVGRYIRFVRAGLSASLQSEHVLAARARGLSELRVILVHGLPPALLPIVPLIAQTLPALFSGALLVERVFDYPGMGLLIHDSIAGGDLQVALVLCLIYAALTMLASGLAEGVSLLLDPRARVAEGT